jgi:O-antigen/teichoic acid export membrane protein
LVHQPNDYFIYYASIAGSAILNIVFNFGRVISELNLTLFAGGWWKHIRRTRVTYAISLLYSISLMLDNVLLGLVSAAAFVGFYAFGIKVVRLSSVVLTDTLVVFFPHAVSLLHQQENQKYQQAILRNIQLLNLFSEKYSIVELVFNSYRGRNLFAIQRNCGCSFWTLVHAGCNRPSHLMRDSFPAMF